MKRYKLLFLLWWYQRQSMIYIKHGARARWDSFTWDPTGKDQHPDVKYYDRKHDEVTIKRDRVLAELAEMGNNAN